MTRLKTVALCLIFALAISAAAASSASALPEWSGPFPKPFNSKSGATLLETVGGTKVKCKSDVNVGEITGANSGFVQVFFKGCETHKFPCASPGAASGEIKTLPLTTTLGYISRVPKVVGLDLANPAGAIVTEFQCVNILAVIRGSVIGRITPVNKAVKPGGHFVVKFTQSKGAQNPSSFAGMPVDILETSLNKGPFEPTGLMSTDALAFLGAAPVTIKA
jgi:hypothetical protein